MWHNVKIWQKSYEEFKDRFFFLFHVNTLYYSFNYWSGISQLLKIDLIKWSSSRTNFLHGYICNEFQLNQI